MTAREVLTLNTTTPQIEVPQAGDTYTLPRDVAISGTLTGVTDLTTTGNTTLGNAVGDTLNVANGSLRVANTGAVGVWVSPSYKFHVDVSAASASAQYVTIDNNYSAYPAANASISGFLFRHYNNGIGANQAHAVIGTECPDVNNRNTNIYFSTMASGSLAEAARITSDKNIVVGTAAVATNATAGFLWITSCAGAPTGAATAPYSNAAAMVVDTTGSKLYVRVGTTWKSTTLA